MSATIALRVDSSESIGSGHTMRCLALAGELSALGAEPAFVARSVPGHANAQIAARGYALHVLDGAAADAAADAAETAARLRSRAAWVVVDHYGLDHMWERSIRQTGATRIFAIDDLVRAHDCELLLDQNTAEPPELYSDRVPAGCRRLLGPRYALLEREFARRRRRLRPRGGKLERVLVSFGSADGANQTPKALAALARPALRDLEIDVVAGRLNRNADAVAGLAAQLPHARFHRETHDMPALIEAADLAIGAGGSMTWERCALGLPALTIVGAPNQRGPATTTARAGATVHLGAARDVDETLIADTVEALRADPRRLAAMAAAALQLVDAQGARRVAEAIVGFDLAKATPDDAELLWRWANDPAVRAHAFQSDPIPLDSHLQWYRERLQDPDSTIYIARVGTTPVGQVRFQGDDGRALVDISVDNAWRGRGIGERILRRGLRQLRAARPRARVVAEVKAANVASQAMFLAAGFTAMPSSRDGAVELLATQAAERPA